MRRPRWLGSVPNGHHVRSNFGPILPRPAGGIRTDGRGRGRRPTWSGRWPHRRSYCACCRFRPRPSIVVAYPRRCSPRRAAGPQPLAVIFVIKPGHEILEHSVQISFADIRLAHGGRGVCALRIAACRYDAALCDDNCTIFAPSRAAINASSCHAIRSARRSNLFARS